MKLLGQRRFGPLFAAQTLGAFNDNLFKNALVVLVIFHAASGGALLVAAAGGVFIAPYAFLSASAGRLADRHGKAGLIRLTKLFEIGLMALASAGLVEGSTPLLFVVLFGLGVQATFFSPLKYGILPEALEGPELIEGNGLIEAGTFAGIIAGTIAGSALALGPGGAWVVSALGLAAAVAGWLAACAVPGVPPAAPGLQVGWAVGRETVELLADARANPPVWRAILALSWFWTLGATLLAEFPVVVRDALHGSDRVLSLMLTVFAAGVGVGSLAVARLLRGRPAGWAVPAAALGLGLFTADFAWAAATAGAMPDPAAMLSSVAGWRMLADLFLVAFCGGAYSVPLYVVVQERSAATHRARMVAANNVVNALAIVAGAAVIAVLSAAGAGAPGVLAMAAALAAVAAALLASAGGRRGALP